MILLGYRIVLQLSGSPAHLWVMSRCLNSAADSLQACYPAGRFEQAYRRAKVDRPALLSARPPRRFPQRQTTTWDEPRGAMMLKPSGRTVRSSILDPIAYWLHKERPRTDDLDQLNDAIFRMVAPRVDVETAKAWRLPSPVISIGQASYPVGVTWAPIPQ